MDHEVRLARVESLRAALGAAECCEGAETAELVRHRYQLQLRTSGAGVCGGGRRRQTGCDPRR